MHIYILETLFIGHNLLRFDSLESTNNKALELHKENALPEGTVIICSAQTKGKGQRGNSWFSEDDKNLTFSIVLTPRNMNVFDVHLLNQITALAVCSFLEQVINKNVYTSIKIKWPNDILVNNKKICGILIENNLQETKIKAAVVGIGININQNNFPEFDVRPTSLLLETGQLFNTDECLRIFLQHFESWYLKLNAQKTDEINACYRSRMWGFNEWNKFETGQKTINGKILGTNNQGKLILETENNDVLHFDLKEIKFII